MKLQCKSCADRERELKEEVRRLKEMILMFACTEHRNAPAWKEQPHVSPLFEEARKFSEDGNMDT